MNIEHTLRTLHQYERKLLQYIKQQTSFEELKQSGLEDVEIKRALQWLSNKGLVTVDRIVYETIELSEKGVNYKQNGLPQTRFMNCLTNDWKSMSSVSQETGMTQNELFSCIGPLKRGYIEIEKRDQLYIKRGPIASTFDQSQLLHYLHQEFPLRVKQEDATIVEQLNKDNVFNKNKVEQITVKITHDGTIIQQQNLNTEYLGTVTAELLRRPNIENAEFRSYNCLDPLPRMPRARKHFVSSAIEKVRDVWVNLGFQEMDGPIVENAFWDMDVLFTPQDHPAREMQDTFYVEGSIDLPEWKHKVKDMHEHGGTLNSKGWQIRFSDEESKKCLLRTHTTSLSAHALHNLTEQDLPAKFFTIGKCFRNEALDWKHLFEFYQVEGIVVDKNLGMPHLKWYLLEFYKQMGYTDVRLRPAYFPYTEPSVEVDGWHPEKQEWVELGGAGILREEVTEMLCGFKCSVLAWGQGMARSISGKYGITDIRNLYENDLEQIQQIKEWRD